MKVRLCLFLLILFCICLCKSSASDAASIKRSVGDFPATIDGPGFRDAFDKADQSGDVIMHHVQLQWTALREASYEQFFDEYKWMRYLLETEHKELQLFLILDVTPASDRKEIINLPDEFKKSGFSDPQLRKAFVEEIVWLADHFKPDYFALAAEIEGYYVGHPDDFAHFVSLYKEAYDRLKERNPEMKVFVYFQYEGLKRLWQDLERNSEVPVDNLWTLIDEFSPKLDAVAFSSYPEVFYDRPEDIPDDYYEQARLNSSLPVIFAELGWSSKFDEGGRPTGTPERQAAFLQRFPDLVSGLNIEMVNWYYLHDMEGERAFRNMPKWWSTMGLLGPKGQKKPVWEVWNNPKTWKIDSDRHKGREAEKPLPDKQKSPEFAGVPGDMDADNRIDRVDFTIFALCMQGGSTVLKEGVCSRGDYDQDGKVDFGDFLKFGEDLKKQKRM